MEQFSLEKYLENQSRKVVTRDGRVVKILDTEFESGNGNKSILAKCIYNNKATVYVYTTDGKANNIGETENDLLFADDESTEFEKALLAAFNCVAGKAITTIGTASFQDDVDEWRKPLLDLARKEFLKNFPKWKRASENKEFEKHVCVMDYYMFPFLDTEVNEGDYYIELSDLKTLPKEE